MLIDEMCGDFLLLIKDFMFDEGVIDLFYINVFLGFKKLMFLGLIYNLM